ncbi:MAG: class I SAM-dependent methyltransferase [Planctomycetales bacterium]|nr:class I SAM-dependent methyltransferase [Planctomycetales bacterium]
MRLSRIIKSYTTPRGYLRRWVIRHTNRTVQAGPFAGMRYVDKAWGSAYVPKLLGTYESELYPVIEQVAPEDYDTLIDIGVAEGYFAVGLALRSHARVIGYECNDRARSLAEGLAKKNGVQENVELRGDCTPAELETTLGKANRPFLLCDVDGYETTLLDPQHTPSLGKTAMLVELVLRGWPGVTAEFFRRFGESHHIELIWQNPRTAADFPLKNRWMRVFPNRDLRHMVDELRPCEQSWMWLTPKTAVAQAA